jgi:hypothetical protein
VRKQRGPSENRGQRAGTARTRAVSGRAPAGNGCAPAVLGREASGAGRARAALVGGRSARGRARRGSARPLKGTQRSRRRRACVSRWQGRSRRGRLRSPSICDRCPRRRGLARTRDTRPLEKNEKSTGDPEAFLFFKRLNRTEAHEARREQGARGRLRGQSHPVKRRYVSCPRSIVRPSRTVIAR